MTTVNGWKRLWLLTSIFWAVAILTTGTPDHGWTMQSALFVVRLWIVPVAAAYAFGSGVGWAMRGFQAEAK